MELTTMLTISTAHIRQETAQLLALESEKNDNIELPVVYKKGDFGYFIHVDEDYLVEDDEGVMIPAYAEVPDDLHACILLALENHCGWLCIDRDGSEVDLPTYEWEVAE